MSRRHCFSLLSRTFAVLLLLRICDGQLINVAEERIPEVLRYDEPTGTTGSPGEDEFRPLSPARIKRLASLKPVKKSSEDSEEDGDDIDPATATIPPNVEQKFDSQDHQYYVADHYMDNEEMLKKHWVQTDKLLDKPGVVGNLSHPLLYKSYRRAVGSKISFKFPFYGHRMSNLTIATGGFIYIGDQIHNWLAATQYIAPLMANFHTYLNNSNIIYADDGNMFVVEWGNVQLREDTQNNTFSFQAILHKNGDIVFAYKDVPLDVSNISDANHPVKLGISDAYLFQHALDIPGSSTPASKRVIYEYHRIEINATKVVKNTVVILKAQPTCIQFESCESCSNASLPYFKCSWCHSKKKHGGPFCTDESGLHRRRQHWAEGNCRNKSKNLYCDGKDEEEIEEDEDARPISTAGDKEWIRSHPDQVIPLNNIPTADRIRKTGGDNGGGYAALTMLVCSALCVVGWLAYAYYNPHTTSGQILIKYRPSRWQIPSSHVRYSASVHM